MVELALRRGSGQGGFEVPTFPTASGRSHRLARRWEMSGGGGGIRTPYLPDSIGTLSASRDSVRPSTFRIYAGLFQDLICDSRCLASDKVG